MACTMIGRIECIISDNAGALCHARAFWSYTLRSLRHKRVVLTDLDVCYKKKNVEQNRKKQAIQSIFKIILYI